MKILKNTKVNLEDGNDNLNKSYDITFADFPLAEITLWFIDYTLLFLCEKESIRQGIHCSSLSFH